MTPKHTLEYTKLQCKNSQFIYEIIRKCGPECISDILNESLWLNDNIMVNKNYLYLKSWENNGISQVRDILNENGEFLTHEELKPNYNITTTFLQTIQVQKSIPTPWIQNTKHCKITKNIHIITDGIYIKINNSLLPVSKTTCKSYYWHIINQDKHRLNIIKKWSTMYPEFNNASQKIWKRMFEQHFKCCRIQRYKVFNLKSFTELFHVTNGLQT